MAQNLMLDPKKRDYVVVNGSPVPTNRVEEKTYIALTIPQGKWIYGANGQGSLLWTLRQKRVPSTDQNFASYSQDAIQRQLIDTGDATQADISNLESTSTGTLNEIKVTPTPSEPVSQFSFVPV